MRREKEGPSGVHLDSKVRRVKGMNLCVKCPKGSTARGKQVSILQFAVEVVDKQSNDLPFFIIKGH